MKKSLCLLLVVGFIILSSCAVPAGKSLEGDTAKSSSSEAKDDTKKSLTDEKAVNIENKSSQKDIDKSGESKIIVNIEKTAVTAYYQDNEGLLIPITRKIEKREGIARAAVQSLIDNTENNQELGLYSALPVLPAETKILGINIKDRTAIIDFNAKLLSYKDNAAERNIISSIVYTLTEFATIDNVRILINGHDQGKLKWGTDISGVLRRDNILINSDKINLSRGMEKLDIFYVRSINNKSICVLPVSKEFNVVSTELLPGKIVEFLSEKTPDKRIFSEIPNGTKLLSCKTNGDLLVLDFNSQLKKYGGTAKEDGIVKQLLYSMKQINGIKKIKILVDGKEGNLPEGTDISKALELPNEINTLNEQ